VHDIPTPDAADNRIREVGAETSEPVGSRHRVVVGEGEDVPVRTRGARRQRRDLTRDRHLNGHDVGSEPAKNRRRVRVVSAVDDDEFILGLQLGDDPLETALEPALAPVRGYDYRDGHAPIGAGLRAAMTIDFQRYGSLPAPRNCGSSNPTRSRSSESVPRLKNLM
jgi:hypothetical protein